MLERSLQWASGRTNTCHWKQSAGLGHSRAGLAGVPAQRAAHGANQVQSKLLGIARAWARADRSSNAAHRPKVDLQLGIFQADGWVQRLALQVLHSGCGGTPVEQTAAPSPTCCCYAAATPPSGLPLAPPGTGGSATSIATPAYAGARPPARPTCGSWKAGPSGAPFLVKEITPPSQSSRQPTVSLRP